MKNIVNFINEKANFLVKKHVTNNEEIDCDITFNELLTYQSLRLFLQDCPNAEKKLKDALAKMNGFAAKKKEDNYNFTLIFKDSYLHIGFFYSTEESKIWTSLLLSSNSEFPDDEWSDCDARGEISAGKSESSQLDEFWYDSLRANFNWLIKHKIN